MFPKTISLNKFVLSCAVISFAAPFMALAKVEEPRETGKFLVFRKGAWVN